MWRFLLLDVLTHDLNGRTGATGGEVRRRPQRTRPEFVANARVVFLTDHAAGDPFKAIDQRRDGDLGGVVHQEVDVVILAVEFHEFSLEVGTHPGEDLAQVIEDFPGKDIAAIFGQEDQVYMHQENTVPAVSNVIALAHRPNYSVGVQRRQAFKYQLMPSGEQQHKMRCFAGSCRFVYNKALALQKETDEAGGGFIGYVAMARHLTGWRNGGATPWLKAAPVHPLQHALKDLDRAYQNFFAGRAGFPRFKKKGQGDRFRYPDPKQIKLDPANSRVFLPKLGWLRYRNSRAVLGTVKNATVSQSGGKWYVSLQTEREVESGVAQGGAVGIDLGVVRFATLSDGSYYEPLGSFKRHEAALRRVQQAMSRKQTFSNNWKKARAEVQRLHLRIANTRRDYLHKTSSAISQNHAIVCIEDLQIRNMSRSAVGSREQPGQQVRAKTGLNKAILDQGWSEFRRQLDYKLAWSGGVLMAVPPQNTSRRCPHCDHISADNRKSQAQFLCVTCGFEEHADVVGAINVLRAGHARFACEVSGEVMPPAAGTHRSDSSRLHAGVSAVGIPRL